MRLHHVQIAIPAEGEEAARRFYVGVLGLTEVEKPAALRGRGGCWFQAIGPSGLVTAEIHAGVEVPFAPARRVHPALVVDSIARLDAIVDAATRSGYRVDASERRTFPGHERVHVLDGHGNRVELLAPA